MIKVRHKLHTNLEKTSKKKKGFTLVELLAVIAIIGLIGSIVVVSVVNIINNSKENATKLAINNVKSAAELYSKENNDEIKWITQYSTDGKETGKFICMTVKQLINNGYFDEKFFDKDIYHDRINDNTFIEIKQGTNADNTNVIIHDSDSTQKDCEMSAINTTLGEIELEDKESYTDRINISVKPKSDEINPDDVDFFASYDKDGEEVPGICTNGDCSFNSLKDDTNYKIKVCMQPKASNTTLTSTVCNILGIPTASFKSPKISVTNAKKWKKFKTVTITYDDTKIYDKPGLHYFKSEVDAEVSQGTIYMCSDNTKNNCNTSTKNIKKDTWYEVRETNNKIEFQIKTHIGKGNNKIITARIQDHTDNYLDNKEEVIRIDTIPPDCKSSGGNSSWINKKNKVVLKGKCTDADSGCNKNNITKPIDYSVNGKVSPGYVYDKVGNKKECPGRNVMVDVDKPKCETAGGSSTWINSKSSTKSRTISVKCTDTGGSSCDDSKTPKPKKYENSYINTNKAGVLGVNNGGKVYDKAGNSANCPANQTVKIDTNPPTCTPDGGTGNNWVNYNVTITGKCNDNNESGCTKNSSRTITVNTGQSFNGSASPGDVYDKAGNSRSCGNVTVKIDKIYPTVKLSGENDNNNLSVSFSDNQSGVKSANWSGGISSSSVSGSSGSAISNGSGNYAYFRVEDNAGNIIEVPHQTYTTCTKTATLSDVKVYKWGSFQSKSCGNNESNKNRKYNFRVGECTCSVDKYNNNHYCGNSSFSETTMNSHPDTWNGSHSTATIHYKNTNNGQRACRGEVAVNSYVKQICENSGEVSGGGIFYHGYMWYSGGVGSFSSFSENSFYHNVQKHCSLKFGNEISNFTQACNAACSYKYNG